MDMNTSRSYTMTARAASTEDTRRGILQAAFDLSAEKFSTAIVLADVAERSGVTVKTILRHFGSREGLLRATSDFAREEIVEERAAPVGDLDAAIEVLHRHYELRGDWVLRMLAQEDSDAQLHDELETGRRVHRAWVAETFGPQLGGVAASNREATIDLLVVATDIYSWKLLRHDLRLGRTETQDRVRTLVRAVLNQ
jgi:AcrR family transcriptional regulator